MKMFGTTQVSSHRRNVTPIGRNEDDYNVLENGVLVGRTFKVRRSRRRTVPGCGRAATPEADARGRDGGNRESWRPE